LNCAIEMTLIHLQGHLAILSENKCSQLFRYLIVSSGDLMNVEIADDLE